MTIKPLLKGSAMTALAAALSLTAFTTQASAQRDRSERAEQRAERIEQRSERRADRVDNRSERRA